MYLRQALFRFRGLCRLRLPQHVVAKMSVPVESERLAWNVDSISTSPSYPAVICLVSCFPEEYEKLCLLGDGVWSVSVFCSLGPCVSADIPT